MHRLCFAECARAEPKCTLQTTMKELSNELRQAAVANSVENYSTEMGEYLLSRLKLSRQKRQHTFP